MTVAARTTLSSAEEDPSDSSWGLLAIILIVAAGAGLVAYAYWPGIMIDDARWQYQQAVDNSYEDWHPPIMAWVWRRLMFILPGPAPMFLVQLLLYWSGITLLSLWAYRRGRPRAAIALACAGWLPAPLALTGTITKDCLMASSLMSASGLLLWRDFGRSRSARAALSIGALVLMLFAAALRFNAFLACLPLLLAACPHQLTRTRLRFSATALSALLVLIAIGPTVAALVQAEHTGVQSSLILFDLGGITERSGQSVFPEMQVRDPVAVNRGCYDPSQWDGYSSWAEKPCPLGFDRFQALVEDGEVDPNALWICAILAHPVAYSEHRLTHFNVSTWFLVRGGPDFTAWTQSVPNPWNYRIRNDVAVAGISAVADFAAHTPFGWPFFWIAVALASWMISVAARMQQEILAISASAFLYGAGYLIFGVATGMRYHFWTISGASLVTILVSCEVLHRQPRIPTKSLISAAMVIVLPTLAGIAARIAS